MLSKLHVITELERRLMMILQTAFSRIKLQTCLAEDVCIHLMKENEQEIL